MRLNGKRVLEIMEINGLTVETLCMQTGLCEKSVQWMLNNGFASEEAMERIADAIAVEVKEILLPDISSNVENAIEFTRDSERATVSFSQGRYITRIKKLAAERPEECEIVAENKDGSICAHVPVTWVKISPPAARSEEQREQARERLINYHAEHGRVTRENE